MVKKQASQPYKDLDSLELYLRSWWSNVYNRPLKDPILDSYTVHELMYEYFDKIERKNAVEEAVERENDKIEDAKLDDTLSWIEEEERKERAEKELLEKENLEKAQMEKDKEWMLQQLKEEYGGDFGEDINLNLDQ